MLVAVRDANPTKVLAAVLRARDRGDAPVVVDPSWPPAVRAAAEGVLSATAAAQASFGAFTSGTAAAPRLVLRTWASWQASHAPFSALAGVGSASTVLVTGPLSATLHLYGAVHATDVGARLLLGHLDDPRGWDVVHLVPAGLDRLLDAAPDLGGRTAVCAGDALPEPLAARATARGLRVIAYYGAAELSFVAAAAGARPLRPFPGVEVDVRDGEVWVRSPYVCTDVVGGPPLLRDGHGFATVGDRRRADGRRRAARARTRRRGRHHRRRDGAGRVRRGSAPRGPRRRRGRRGGACRTPASATSSPRSSTGGRRTGRRGGDARAGRRRARAGCGATPLVRRPGAAPHPRRQGGPG